MEVFDVAGRIVKTLVDEEKGAGACILSWDGKDENGRRVSNGVYFLRLSSGDLTATRKVSVLR